MEPSIPDSPPTNKTMTNSHRPVLNLSVKKLALFYAKREGTDLPRKGPERRVPGGRAPLSFPQRRLWFTEQALESRVQNNISSLSQIRGPLIPEVLQRCFEEVVRRHEVLRSGIVVEEGVPAQVPYPPRPFQLPVVDLSRLPDDERESTAMRIAEGEGRSLFDLVQGPLLRARLVRLEHERHLLVVVAHHIASDGWSLGILIREVTTLYAALLAGKPSPLQELPLQYGDFACWQQALPPERLEALLSYWRKRLVGEPPTVLPLDHRRPSLPSHRGGLESFRVSPELRNALQSLAHQERATLFMVLLSAFKVMLHRCGGEEDISVGTPVAGRTHSDLEGLVGFFVNLVVLRSDLSGAPTFRQLLGQVRETTLSAFAHQDLPFEQLVEHLQPARKTSQTPFFHTLFVMQTAALPQIELENLDFETIDLHNGTSKFDLTLEAREEDDGLTFRLEFSTELFERSTIQRFADHLQYLLTQLVADPDIPVSQFALAPPQQGLLRAWNATDKPIESDHALHRIVELQVARTPERIALVGAEESLTYAELNARANQVAHYLSTRGIQSENLVGVCLERTPDLVVALLGILKTGAGYVPVDPKYPATRREYLLRDSGVRLVLTEDSLKGMLPKAIPTLDIAECLADGAMRPNPDSAVDPSSVAYLIYTSGSTGQPKGVMVEHRNAVAFLDWVSERFSAEEMRAVLASTSICFDLSIFELFGTLAVGGMVILADNALQLHSLPLANQVTLINSVPSVVRELLREGALPHSVVTVNLAGEALPGDLVRALYAFKHVRRVFNLYGPSEDTTYSTWSLTSAETLGDPPIGVPLSNKRSYVLDSALNPVPVGITGELYLAGAGLARGYWRQPKLTAASFIPDPFSTVPGGRLYKTGDAVFRRPDGSIQYRGRVDSQVKVNGFRIELGEIETALRTQPSVADAAVAACEDDAGRRHLVAFCVARNEGGAPGVAGLSHELRRALSLTLPTHMVPTAWTFLDVLPRSPAGKLDRQQLAATPFPKANTSRPMVEPRDDLERKLGSIWASVLGLRDVCVKTSFFEVGGHSMLAMQLVAQIESAHRVRVPISQFYAAPTIEELARFVRQDGSVAVPAKHSLLVPLQPNGPGPALFCAHPAGGHMMDYKELATALAFHQQPLFGFQSRGLEEDATPLRDVGEMAALYVEDILSAQQKGPYLLAGYCTGGTVAYEMAQQLRAKGREVAFLGMLDSRAPSWTEGVRPSFLSPDLVAKFAAGELGITLEAGLFDGSAPELWMDLVWREFHRQSAPAAERLTEPMFRRLFGVYTANSEAVIRYRPQPYSGHTTVFAAAPVRIKSDEYYTQVRQEAMGWREFSEVKRILVPGNHVTMMRPPQVAVLAQLLVEQITLALQKTGAEVAK